jgi:AAA domain/RepB DNA-primase from phage plasmid/Primase C terminal 2 (PriCT-2)
MNPTLLELPPDLEAAREHLSLLGGNATRFLFWTGDDNKSRNDPTLRSQFYGTLDDAWPELVKRNARGAGVFVCIAETDDSGSRKIGNIQRPRAVFVEDDDKRETMRTDWPQTPTFVVESSPGKYHYYWTVEGLDFETYAGVMRTMVAAHGCDPNAKDLSRVLRLAGFNHMKNPSAPHQVRIAYKDWVQTEGEFPLTVACVVKAFKPLPAPVVPERPALDRPFDAAKTREAFEWAKWDWETRDSWLKAGFAINHGSGGSEEGRALWRELSAVSARYDEDGLDHAWDHMEPNRERPVTLASVFKRAHDNGMPKAERQDAAAEFEAIEGASRDGLLEDPTDVSVTSIVTLRNRALVKGLILPTEVGVLYGDPGAGKTFAALDLAWHVALGAPWQKHKTMRAPVLYVALEGVPGFQMRVRAVMQARGDPQGFFKRLKAQISLTADADGTTGLELIKRACVELEGLCGQRVGLVVIDTFAAATGGDDENATKEMTAFIEKRLKPIGEATGAAVLIVHHTNKAGTMRGSSALTGAADFIIRADREKDAKGNPVGDLRQLFAQKVKDGEEGLLLRYKLAQVKLIGEDGQVANDADGVPVTSCVIECAASETDKLDAEAFEALKTHWSKWSDARFSPSLNSGATSAAKLLCAAMGAAWHSEGDVQRALERLEKAGKLRRQNHKPSTSKSGTSKSGKLLSRWVPDFDPAFASCSTNIKDSDPADDDTADDE